MSGSEINPTWRAELSPNALDKASPGPHEFLPGAHILMGPEYLSLPIYKGWMTPPASSILERSFRASGLCDIDSWIVEYP